MTDPRLERLLTNIARRTELVRDQLARARIGGNLATVILTDLEAAHRQLIAAANTGDVFAVINATEAVAAVVQRANLLVVVLRRRPPSRKQRKAAAVRDYVLGHSATGKTTEEIIAMKRVPQSTVYRILKLKREVRKVKG